MGYVDRTREKQLPGVHKAQEQGRVSLPFGDKVTAGIECILGSAIYLKSTGMSLQKEEICMDEAWRVA